MMPDAYVITTSGICRSVGFSPVFFVVVEILVVALVLVLGLGMGSL